MNQIVQVKEDLVRHEGLRKQLYKDHLGYYTIGVGRLLDPRKGGGLSYDECLYLLDNDVKEVIQDLDAHLSWWQTRPAPVKRALMNMCFQMGIGKLLGFKRTLAHMEDGHYELAADEALDSLWAKQTPERAQEVASWIRSANK